MPKTEPFCHLDQMNIVQLREFAREYEIDLSGLPMPVKTYHDVWKIRMFIVASISGEFDDD